MSRSRKKPYYKDKGMSTQDYWTIVRHEWKQNLKQNYWKDDLYFRNPSEIINDWTRCDYIWFFQESRPYWGEEEPRHWFGYTKEDVKKYSRK